MLEEATSSKRNAAARALTLGVTSVHVGPNTKATCLCFNVRIPSPRQCHRQTLCIPTTVSPEAPDGRCHLQMSLSLPTLASPQRRPPPMLLPFLPGSFGSPRGACCGSSLPNSTTSREKGLTVILSQAVLPPLPPHTLARRLQSAPQAAQAQCKALSSSQSHLECHVLPSASTALGNAIGLAERRISPLPRLQAPQCCLAKCSVLPLPSAPPWAEGPWPAPRAAQSAATSQ